MGRHGGKKRRFNPLIIGLTVAAVVLVVGLGWWWWNLRSPTDPVSADPVQAYATVTDSGPCTTAGATTTVEMNTNDGVVSATLRICGYRVDQPILVEYLRSDPTQARVYGTSSAPASSVVQKLLPVAILLLGVIAAGAALAMLRERRKPRVTDHPISVAELRAARLAEGAQGASSSTAAVNGEVTGTGETAAMKTALPGVSRVAETPMGMSSDHRVGDTEQTAPAHPDDAYSARVPDDVAAQPIRLDPSSVDGSAAPPYSDDLFGAEQPPSQQDR